MSEAFGTFLRIDHEGSVLLRDCDIGTFRLAVSPGGCSGLAADISVRREPAAGEAVVERDGVKLFLPAESRILLDGVTIDFADTPSQTGLVFRDPKQVSCSSH